MEESKSNDKHNNQQFSVNDSFESKYDKEANAANKGYSCAYRDELHNEILHCMEKYRNIYQVLHYRPDLRESLLVHIDKVTSEMLQNLTTKKEE
ncbi:MAG: hypothetical protein GX946_10110 [Oligosphaeraceae bacterium]|nr:hypothetical protein [Oligosphaeraceae bacterium]